MTAVPDDLGMSAGPGGLPSRVVELARELADSGRVVLETSMAKLWLALVIALGFTAVGIAMLVAESSNPIAWLAVGFFGVLGIPVMVWTIVRGGQQVVVDQQGVTIGKAPTVAWDQMEDVSAVHAGTSMVQLHIAQHHLDVLNAEFGRGTKRLGRIGTALVGRSGWQLPTTLHDKPAVLAAWLHHEVQRRR